MTATSRKELPRPTNLGWFGKGMIFFVVVTFIGVMVTVLLALAIWPGEVKLVAPLFCPDERPDAFIVSDTYSVQPGETTTNYTLYCMGPDGDASDEGFMLPFLATAALNTTIVAVLLAAWMYSRRRRRARRPAEPDPLRPEPPDWPDEGFVDAEPPDGPSQPPPGSSPGPFVS